MSELEEIEVVVGDEAEEIGAGGEEDVVADVDMQRR